jgi:ABC-type protease/lipase transport system fused ATPase/permease subunit
VEFLPGTVAENIARFRDDGPIDHAAVLEAAELSEIQDIISKLPNGYNTVVGFDGHAFSGGQRQRIALARAIYGNPKLLVLDEPNSNLDTMGEQSLGRALLRMKERNTTIVIVTHRLNMLNYCDDVLVMNAGTVHTFGVRDTVLNKLSAYRPSTPAALASVKV